MIVAVISGAFSMVLRYRETGHLPMVNLYEITFFYAWTISALYALFIKADTGKITGGVILSILLIIASWDIFLDKSANEINPLLDSFWLGIHVPAAMISYGAFALSFAVSVFYLLSAGRMAVSEKLLSFNSKLIAAGAALLAVCIITGAVWAKDAWGQYWSWDPKETWALITLIIYTANIAAVRGLKLGPKWQAALSVLGFCVMLFTFFGVSLLMAGSHAYM